MTVRTSMSEAVCPVARSLDVLGDPWTLLVLREVFSGNRRFDGIKAGLGITDTVLSNRLQRLVDEGLLDRSPYGGTVRPRVEYVLTEAGEDTLPVLHALARWGRRHTTSPVRGGGILLVECLECGQPSESADWCTTCVAPLNRDRTGWRRASEPEKLIALATA
ncbi:helix-turn-helix domain-containing protein [Mycobacterium sp.]|jgi:DNA-binding HxlR family transcriptional regulator|uniref:winged helix-turn-helix transcriptional regulator n=1 Tax=Mycobacterium sp. TaxID=1785 RepID=UPI002CB998F2|nr:helix-turn-helix domain-containing protein [Mycobacterium sp.]HTH91231.1 helix-turn-helix domain-containing protein [Mycobacterium sp.]